MWLACRISLSYVLPVPPVPVGTSIVTATTPAPAFLKFYAPEESGSVKLARTSEDIERFESLIQYAKSAETITEENFQWLEKATTPWLAQQLGVYAEHLERDGQATVAARVAWLGVLAAKWVRDDAKYYLANLLTAGNMWLKLGAQATHSNGIDAARGFFEAILHLAAHEQRKERLGAHVGMASYYGLVEDYVGAAFHVDRYLPYIDEIVPRQQHQTVYGQAARIYGKVQDIPGLLFCCERLGKPLPPASQLSAQSLDAVLMTVARLNSLGSNQTAFRIMSEFKSRNRSA